MYQRKGRIVDGVTLTGKPEPKPIKEPDVLYRFRYKRKNPDGGVSTHAWSRWQLTQTKPDESKYFALEYQTYRKAKNGRRGLAESTVEEGQT